LWFVEALKKRGVTVESLVIEGAPKATPAKVAKKAAQKPTKKTSTKKTAKK
jgi:DNA-binding protein H-NS